MSFVFEHTKQSHQRRMSTVSLENLQSFCRICLAHLDHQTVKYNIHEVRNLSKWILSCTTMIALPHDNLPQFVCHQCYGKLRLFNEFRSMSLQSMQFLHSILRPNRPKNKSTRNAEADSLQLKSGEQEQVLSQVFGHNDWQEFHYESVEQSHFSDEPLFKELDDDIVEEQIFADPIGLPTLNVEEESEYTTELDVGQRLPAKDEEVNGQEKESSIDLCSANAVESELTGQSTASDNDKDGINYEADKDGNMSDNSVGSRGIRARRRSRSKSLRGLLTKRKLKAPGMKSSTSTSTSTLKKQSTTTFQCDRCPRRCFNQDTFEAHKRTHDGLKPYECAECKRTFSKAHHYRVHMREAHPAEKREIACTYEGCGKVFERETTYKAHCRTKHTEVNHIRVPKIYICDQCGCTFRNATKLKEHSYKHAPPEDYPYKCGQCDKRFAKKSSYNEHMLRHAGVKNFECPYCGMKKTTNHELRTHINYHTKERQWPCQQCSMVFNSAANLGMHDRVVHKGIKRYTCRYCDQSFGKSDTWKHHEMRHTGEKPHRCEICDKRFIQSVALRAHMKTHNKFDNKQKPKSSK